MRMRLPSRYSLFSLCVVSVLLGCVSPVFASKLIPIQSGLTLPSLTDVAGLTFQSALVDQSEIQSYNFSEETSQGLILPTAPTSPHLQPLVISQDILEAPSFVQGPVDLPPSETPTVIPSLPISPTATPTKPTPTPTKEVTPTVNQVPADSLIPTVTPTPTEIPTVTPTPTLPPIPPASDIDGYFAKYSNDYHVDIEVLRRIARCESGYNAHAQYLDYGGMFQFSTNSWIVTRQAMGLDTNPDLRFSAEESIRTAAFKISQNGTGAWPNC